MKQPFFPGHAAALAALLTTTLVAALVWNFRVVAEATDGSSFGSVDPFHYFYPMLEAGFSRLRDGHLFLWNPHQLGGMPGIATLQAGFLYPPHLIYLLLPTSTGMAAMATMHIVLAAWFSLLLGRIWGMGWTACTVAATFYSCGAVATAITWPPAQEAMAWLPLGVAAIEKLVGDCDRRWLPVLVLATAMPVLAGAYQTATAIYYSYVLFGITCLVGQATRASATGRSIGARAAALTTAALAGAALAAPQLFLTGELLGMASRSAESVKLDQVLTFGRLWGTWTALATALLAPAPSFLDHAYFLGMTAFALATVGLAHIGARCWPLLILLAFGVLSLHTPTWFLELRPHLPILGWFRWPPREFFLARFAMAFLAGFGVHRLLSANVVSALPRPLAVASASAIAVVCVVLSKVFASMIPTLLGATAALALAVLPLRGAVRCIVLAFVLIALLHDAVPSRTNRFGLPYVGEEWRTLNVNAKQHALLASVAGFDRSVVVPASLNASAKAAMLHGTLSPFDYDPLALARLGHCLEAARRRRLGAAWSPRRYPFDGTPTVLHESLLLPDRRCLDLLAVRWSAVPRAILLGAPLAEHWTVSDREVPASEPLAPGTPGLPYVLLHNPVALARAYGVYRAECIQDDETWLDRLFTGGFDLTTTVAINRPSPCPSGWASGKGHIPAPIVRIEHAEDTDIRLSCEFGTDGFLVLTDSWYPGWTATVNGAPVEILRANGLVRAVRVPAGTVDVVFHYTPTWLWVGWGVAAVGVLVCVAALLMPRGRGRVQASGLET